MKKDFVKLAAIGLLAAFCLSAQDASKDEVAMSKCTKDNNTTVQPHKKCHDKSEKPDCNSCKKKPECGHSSDYSDDGDQQSDASQAMKTVRKGAAQKAVEGE